MKRLVLGLGLIAAAAAVLLLSDLRSRATTRGRVPRVAIFQHVSQGIIDEGVEGMVAALADAGFSAPRTMEVTHFNAQGDVATANAIAKQIATGHYDLVLTATTLSLQAMAAANTSGATKHVFGLVSDPVSSGVGITSLDSPDHPAHLTGLGTLQPVRATFELARQVYPALKTVGVAYNPAESNSVANLKLGRVTCQALGIELLEATVDNSSAVGEVVSSLVSRGAEAIWVGGDVAVMTAMDSAVAAARRGRIPIFTSMPGSTARGALFDIGANYREVGRMTGALAVRVLQGANPADIPVHNALPERVLVNEAALEGLKAPWRIPAELAARAKASADTTSAPRAGLARKWNVQLIQLNNVLDVEDVERGIFEGLADQELERGKDFEITVRNAQGDMATLSGLVDAAIADGADLLLTLSSPTLQAAIQRAKGRVPIVFTYVSSAVAAGAGTSATDHLPNVTGVETLADMDEMTALIKAVRPGTKRIGTLYAPAEVNMVYSRDKMKAAADRAGLTLVDSGVATSTEVADAALALTSRDIDVLCQIPGNLTASAFGGIAQAARRRQMPVFAFQKVQVQDGAMLVLARDYDDAGRQAAGVAARVMRGANPASIPFAQMTKSRLIINKAVVRALGIVIPDAVLKRAAEVIE